MFSIFDTFPLPTIVVNDDFLVAYININGVDFFNNSNEKLKNTKITSLFPELDLNSLSQKKVSKLLYTNEKGIEYQLFLQYETHSLDGISHGLFYVKDYLLKDKTIDNSIQKMDVIDEKLGLFDFLFNQINEGVLIFNSEGQLIYINKTALSLFSLFDKKIKNNFAWQFPELFESKSDWETKNKYFEGKKELPFTFNKKNNLNVESAFSGVINFRNILQKDYCIITYTDISESVSDRRFNDSVLFNIPADIAVFDKNHNYIFINPNGIANDELRNWMIGKNDFDYFKFKNLDSAPAVQRRAYFNKAKDTKQQVDWVDEIVKGGTKTHVLRRFYPYYVEDEFVYMIGYGIDISELKRTQNVLSEAQKQNELILKSSLDGVILVDNDWKIIYWNPQAEQIFGWNSKEVVGCYLPEIIFPNELENKSLINLNFANKVNKEQAISTPLEFNASKKDGKQLSIELSLVGIDEHENTYNYCIFITDISFRKEKEIKIEQQNKILLSQNKQLEEFTYIASHDLQEPLLSLISYSKLLEEEYEDKLDEEGKLFVQFINKSALRMRSLISGLMQYARINKTEDLTKTDLKFLLQEVQEDLTSLINNNGAIITHEKLPNIYCYPTYIRLLFQNLISNAIKFTKNDVSPTIHINCSERDTDWLFQIKDNGIGIDAKNSEQIFMIFKRLHSEQDYVGNGIGLAHCKKIIEVHNGEIWVESIEGNGSVFNFTISKEI